MVQDGFSVASSRPARMPARPVSRTAEPMAPPAAAGAPPATTPRPPRHADDDDVLTVDELVSWLRLSESTVLKLLSERAIPARKVGHQWRIRRGRVRDWLDGHE
ncbi:helix-turn-helix domain-containing protein [Parafrankia discariae]|uniref:helix-turn-helix domain-containing protein n=1 Tax=Parafrankia discariae TaxID=365528 RepID=UPI000361ADB3|nr:helix-turn-helix domain-containing protein [Parafrankia discariae]